jgi:hypothetical protein
MGRGIMPSVNGAPTEEELRKSYEKPKCGRNFYGYRDTDVAKVTEKQQAELDAQGNPKQLSNADRQALEKRAKDNAMEKAKATAESIVDFKCPERCRKKEGTGNNAKVEPVYRQIWTSNPYIQRGSIDLRKIKMAIALVDPNIAALLPNMWNYAEWCVDGSVEWQVFILCSKP